MANIIYDKTEKGQDEILTRKNHLASRMRSLLVLVDGKTNHDALLKKVAGLGLTEESIAELLQLGLIEPHAAQIEAVIAAPPQPIQQDAPAEKPTAILAEGESLYQALYNFYTTTIKSTLGLRGYAMQLKVERCANIDDFKALRQTYVEAVLKSKGPEMARSLGDRLDQLLSLA
ncbi:MAG TPA: hypothetical protein VK832_07450 [Burkholderiaceae bacterium]|jgi:hypothetical protein|nr:hypothetical protein [Burkholderiaceae bacterium]